MTPTYSTAPDLRYPDYYILDIDDLVTELCDQWHDVIATEVAPHCDTVKEVYPEVYSIDPITHQITKQVHVAQHHAVSGDNWRPDISFILTHVIDTIKQRNDLIQDMTLAMQLLEYDIATLTHYQLAPNLSDGTMRNVYTDTRMKIAKVTAQFGKKLFQRFNELGMYKNGYFPYHFAGWQDRCALVRLDAGVVSGHIPLNEVDPPLHELENPYG